MGEVLLDALSGGWCLIWLAAVVMPGVRGRQRHRWGVPGGRRAVASAVCGMPLPALLIGLFGAHALWPRETENLLDGPLGFAVALAAAAAAFGWVVSLGLIVAAGAGATAAIPDDAPAPPRPGTTPGATR